MITTQSDDSADLFRLLRSHGWSRNLRHSEPRSVPGIDPRYQFENVGFNVRPLEVSGAFGLRQLARLPGFQEQRRTNAERFRELVSDLSGALDLMHVAPGGDCSWFALPMVVRSDAPFTRDELAAHLEASGVETRPVVAGNLARQPVVDVFPELAEGDLPGADRVHNHGFYLGLHPFPAEADLERLAGLIRDFVTSR